MNKSFYNIIINDYAGNNHMSARVYSDKTFSIHLKKGDKTVYTGTDSSLIKAFINKASTALHGSQANNFKIAFDYRNNRLHFKVKKGGVVTMATSRCELDEERKKRIVFDTNDEVFCHQNYVDENDILSKFRAMRECADGFMRIINHRSLAHAG